MNASIYSAAVSALHVRAWAHFTCLLLAAGLSLFAFFAARNCLRMLVGEASAAQYMLLVIC